MTLFELLAYVRPFAAETEAGIMYKVMNETPALLRTLCPDCPQALENLVKRMLEKSASARYQSMGEVARDLGTIWKQSQHDTIEALLTDARQRIDSRDFMRAQEILGAALQVDITSLAVKGLLDQVNREIRRLEVLPRVQEQLNRARAHLQAGRYAEAKVEVEAALRMDSRHGATAQLLEEIEEASRNAEALQQRLRLARKRLAEGALTEAQVVLDEILQVNASDGSVRELKRQIEEEQDRQKQRRQLAELRHRARELWTEQLYQECVRLLEEGLQQFPRDPELAKLMETAKQDWAEEEKRRNLGLVRKLVGQRQFDQARTILGELEKENPQDRAVLKLRDLVEQGEREINREIRLTKRVAELRRLVREEKFADVTAQGEALLQEYQHDYELEELVAYARTESARRQAEEREAGLAKQIQDALTAKRYNDAAAKAQKAVREFPGHPQFQKLWEETEQKRKEQAIRDEFQRRIQDIQRRITRQELTEAIDIAQQTLATMGPSEQVSQLLQAAKVEQREKIQRDQQQRLDEIATLLDGGKLDGATQMLNDAFATQIFQPSHPRAKDLLAQIASRSGTAYQPKAPSTEIATQTAKPYVPESSPEPSLFSATKVLTPTPTPAAADANPAGLLESPQAPGRSPARQNSPAPVRSDSSVPAAVDRPPGARQIRRGKSVPSRLKWDVGRFLTALKDRAVPVGLSLRELSVRGTGAIAAWRLSPRDLAAKRRVILAVGGAVVLVGSVSIGLRMWRDCRNVTFSFGDGGGPSAPSRASLGAT